LRTRPGRRTQGQRRTVLHADLLRHRVRRKMRNWCQRGAGRDVMGWLREGVRMNWRSQPPPPFHQGRSLTDLTKEEQAFMDREIPRCLKTGAWVTATDARWVSKAFLVPKPGFKT
jgi:hypothetical protein